MMELDEQVTIKMTRAQAAATVMAMSYATGLPAPIAALADQANRIIQGSGASVGVISRLLGEVAARR